MYAGFFVLVTYMDRSSLYCSSPNLFDSLLKVTPFCVITGNYNKEAILITMMKPSDDESPFYILRSFLIFHLSPRCR